MNLNEINKMETVRNKCLECGEWMVGRIDKKYCDIECKNLFNNRLNRDENNLIRNVNNILRRNRRILSKYYSIGKDKVERDRLLQEGFQFRYYTGTYKSEEGNEFLFCYDQGYSVLNDGFVSLRSLPNE